MLPRSFLLAAACVLPALASVPLRELPGSTTSGTLEIPAPPEVVYRRLTSYARWSPMFSDLTTAALESGGRENATLRFTSKIFRHTLRVRFQNSPSQSVRYSVLEGAPKNVQVGQEWRLAPTADGGRTLVEEQVHLEVHGPFSLFFTAAKVKEMREQKVRADLQDLAATFK